MRWISLLPEGRNRIVERAKDYLEEHYYEDLSLTEVPPPRSRPLQYHKT